MPNTFAYIALFSWPLFTIFFVKRYGLGNGALIALLGAYMFLPVKVSVDPPGLPPLDKFSITTLTIIIFYLFSGNGLGLRSLDKKYFMILVGFIIFPFITAITNQHSYLFLPGMQLYDGLSGSIKGMLYLFPFLIGVRYFRTEEAQLTLFKYFALAAFIYTFFVLFEIRMSPQLHTKIYGFFPHSWLQQYRGGGFRAIVFMGHGLLVAMFLALGVAFWAVLNKTKQKIFRFSTQTGLWLVFITLALSKSYAALVYGVFALLAIKYLKVQRLYLVAMLMGTLFITYPILSATGIFPHKELVEVAKDINQDRAQSLEFRFDNENILLAHANKKPWFGWGDWGRNRVYNAETGEDISVTDGGWIILLGTSGWMGFLSQFLFMFLPIYMVFRNQNRLKYESDTAPLLLAAHCLIVGLIMIDQLPNASLNPVYWLVVGSLVGRTQYLLNNKMLKGKNNIHNTYSVSSTS